MSAKKIVNGHLPIQVKKNLILALVLLFFLPSTYCQSYDKSGRKYFETKNVGSAKEITGSTYILSIFASEGDEQWTLEGKKQFMNKEKLAYDWISKQVKNYKKSFTYQRGMYYGADEDFKLSKRIKVGSIDSIKYSRNNVYPMVLAALKTKGYQSTKGFCDYISTKFGCKNVLVNLYIKGKGQSYAQSCFTTSDSTSYLEIVVICEKNKWDYETYVSDIAHETLHLFGAWDLYAVTTGGKQNEEMAKQKFESSIFLHTKQDINLHTIDEVNAWRIGLLAKKDWYLDFIPVHYYW